jgi:hypothetical protein
MTQRLVTLLAVTFTLTFLTASVCTVAAQAVADSRVVIPAMREASRKTYAENVARQPPKKPRPQTQQTLALKLRSVSLKILKGRGGSAGHLELRRPDRY